MDRALWIAKKNQICVLIKKLSDEAGGDEVVWLRSVCQEIIENNKNDMDDLLGCVLDLVSKIPYIPRKVPDVLCGTKEPK